MPKENKHSRGRRKEEKDKKRKREDSCDGDVVDGKRQKTPTSFEDPEVNFIGLDNAPQNEDASAPVTERPFYGMLEDEEQEYFRRADELLELNDFPTTEERDLFLENVFREAEGKELKIACSQSCSRLMERLILLSSTKQKKKLFGVFAGNFSHLCQHRFASHCVEGLFIGSAGVVTRELTGDEKLEEKRQEGDMGMDQGEENVENSSMESLFLATLDELEGQMTFLLTDRFASHTLRVLLVILSGRPLEKSSTSSLLQSKKKEKISVANVNSAPTEFALNKRAVPESFQFAVEKIISDTVATMDTSFIRVLATHPTGNPTLQLLLELELTNPTSKKGVNADQKTIISALLPDDIGEEGSSSAVFVNGLMYDQIGSRLLETICEHAPGKLFKQIYKSTFKERIAGLARNEISSYVVIKVLNRLSKEDLEDAVEQMGPQIQGLAERNRTVIIKTLFERSYARHSTKSVEKLVETVGSSYGSDPSTLLLKMACIEDVDALIRATSDASQPNEDVPAEEEGEEASKPKKKITKSQPLRPTPQQTHGSLLAQSLLNIPGGPSALIHDSLLSLPQPTLQAFALYTPTSHIIQAAFTPKSPPIFRRKLINTLLFSPDHPDALLTLALSPTGSHTLDALLPSTASINSLFTLTERIAVALTHHEATLRDSFTGRIVWKNWQLDLFKRRRGEWVNTIKQLAAAKYPSAKAAIETNVEEAVEEPAVSATKSKKNKKNGGVKGEVDAGPKKSAIQLARERHAAKKAGVGGVNAVKIGHKGTGVNSGKIGAKKSTDHPNGDVHPSRKVVIGL
ncbi:ARM repeat-containing protein [Glarea lozoyensis ATCC 20868]|uniref:Nucleolar protein 9 n=1 Tax=Glarea lozoyensis (strain ATCC 20868 / MF5171) TaxID=1116229 RepID=S3DE19_GLAL2|nr:ARM repeat-containing protein [Glarea lozoyensis ATCC 20868]EPE35329.1 ARM repeat-containing protein [Glarea lozoyensis ATCC 20868]